MNSSRKLIPYILHKRKTDTLMLYKLSLFLTNGGRGLWDVGNESPEEILQENGFVVTEIHKTPEHIYARIDPEKTNMSGFYTWKETRKEDCWRSFHLCFDVTMKESWFTSKELETQFEGSEFSPYRIFCDLRS